MFNRCQPYGFDWNWGLIESVNSIHGHLRMPNLEIKMQIYIFTSGDLQPDSRSWTVRLITDHGWQPVTGPCQST
eukprot:1143164-Pelagomonas_calceolata.AAC.4